MTINISATALTPTGQPFVHYTHTALYVYVYLRWPCFVRTQTLVRRQKGAYSGSGQCVLLLDL